MSHHQEHRTDEVLELLWTQQEASDHRFQEVIRLSDDPDVAVLIEEMERKGWVSHSGTDLTLTQEGQEKARMVIRRHRLAERLLVDLFDFKVSDDRAIESSACAFEHVLNEEVIDRVCGFLGHPPLCPHGKPIPPGEGCCNTYRREVKPIVSRLADLGAGTIGRISFMAPKTEKRMERLAVMGVIPGALVRVKQTRPAVVIQVDETVIAIDPAIAAEIYVRGLDDGPNGHHGNGVGPRQGEAKPGEPGGRRWQWRRGRRGRTE